MTGAAQVLAMADVRRLQQRARRGADPYRNEVLLLLSFKAGLRACEMAGLKWSMVCDARGRIGNHINISGSIAKYGRPRRMPLHADLKRALIALRKHTAPGLDDAIIRSQRGTHMKPRSIVNWFAAMYRDAGLAGCSSHSGRRTFITQAARNIAKTGGSLRDVQELAGHRALTTTERYIEGDRDAQRRLVRLL